MEMYPLSKNADPKDIKSKTGKSVDEINIENIKNGYITKDDIKISKETLMMQANVARESSREQLADNFERASELIDIDDKVLLGYYEKLRPNRATKKELLDIANILKEKHKAYKCAAIFEEAAVIYEKRNLLL